MISAKQIHGLLRAPAACVAGLLAATTLPPQSLAQEKPVVSEPSRFADFEAGDRQPCEGLPGCDFTLVRGDPATGSSQWVFRFAAGTPFPKHWHSTPENMVGIRGTLTFNFETGEQHALGAGDFLNYQTGMIHWGQCEAGEDCVFYAFNDLPYDIHVVE